MNPIFLNSSNDLRKSAMPGVSFDECESKRQPMPKAAFCACGAPFTSEFNATFDALRTHALQVVSGSEQHRPRPRGAPASSDPPRSEEISHRKDARRKLLTGVGSSARLWHITHANVLCCGGRLSNVRLTTTACFHGPEHGLFRMIWKSLG